VSGNGVASSQAITTGTWRNISQTYDYNTLACSTYVDGVFINSGTFKHFNESSLPDNMIAAKVR
jgi:hypothetical protein